MLYWHIFFHLTNVQHGQFVFWDINIKLFALILDNLSIIKLKGKNIILNISYAFNNILIIK